MRETEEGLRSLEELRPRLEQEDLDVSTTVTLELRFYHPEVEQESETSYRPQGSLFLLSKEYIVELGFPDRLPPWVEVYIGRYPRYGLEGKVEWFMSLASSWDEPGDPLPLEDMMKALEALGLDPKAKIWRARPCE